MADPVPRPFPLPWTRPTVQIPVSTPQQYAVLDSHALRPFGSRRAAAVVEDQALAPFSLKGVHVSLGEWLAGPPEQCTFLRVSVTVGVELILDT